MASTSRYICEIERLAVDEQDPPVRRFFETLLRPEVRERTRSIIEDIIQKRESITPEHLPYLLFISLQYCTDLKYDMPIPTPELAQDLADSHDDLVKLCVERNASTNVISRYAHLQIALEVLDRPVTVLDIGTALGLGLMSLNTSYITEVDVDHELQPYLQGTADIEKRIGIDTQPRDLDWSIACYLPENQGQREVTEERYRELKSAQNIDFHQLDLFDLPESEISAPDIIWTSSVRYQIQSDEEGIRTSLLNTLSEDGIWLDANYRDPDMSFTDSANPYLIRAFSKKHELPLEILQSPSDRVQRITKGRDFDEFKQRFR